MKKTLSALLLVALAYTACTKDNSTVLGTHYFLVRMKTSAAKWQDSAFVVATKDTALIRKITHEFSLPVNGRMHVIGTLISGNGGYNINGSHQFKWHLKEDAWNLTETSIELSDGRPYSDVDADTTYWLYTVKSFGPWNSYVAKEINKP